MSIFDNAVNKTTSSSDPIQTESKDNKFESNTVSNIKTLKNIINESEQIKTNTIQNNNNTHESFESYNEDENEESAKKLFEILLNNKEKDPKIQRSILLLDVNEICPLEPLGDNIDEDNNTYIQGISILDELSSKMPITRKIYHG